MSLSCCFLFLSFKLCIFIYLCLGEFIFSLSIQFHLIFSSKSFNFFHALFPNLHCFPVLIWLSEITLWFIYPSIHSFSLNIVRWKDIGVLSHQFINWLAILLHVIGFTLSWNYQMLECKHRVWKFFFSGLRAMKQCSNILYQRAGTNPQICGL